MPTRSQLLNPEFYVPLLFNLVRMLFILIFAYLSAKAIGRLLKTLRIYIVKMMLKGGGDTEYELEKRVQTILGVTRKVLYVLIWAIALIMVLKEMNFDVRPLLAGASIVGVAVGFGAQSIVKDVLKGKFFFAGKQIFVPQLGIIQGK